MKWRVTGIDRETGKVRVVILDAADRSAAAAVAMNMGLTVLKMEADEPGPNEAAPAAPMSNIAPLRRKYPVLRVVATLARIVGVVAIAGGSICVLWGAVLILGALSAGQPSPEGAVFTQVGAAASLGGLLYLGFAELIYLAIDVEYGIRRVVQVVEAR